MNQQESRVCERVLQRFLTTIRKVLECMAVFVSASRLQRRLRRAETPLQAICARMGPATGFGGGGTKRKRWSRPVSRVLYVLRRDSHSSRPGVAAWLQQPTREQRGPRYRSPIWSCSEWGLPCRTTLAPYAVRSYRTLSPLPDPLARPSAVCSLLHWPSAHAAQELPGTLPYGARTFLDALACDATVRPTPLASLVDTQPDVGATSVGATQSRYCPGNI